MTILITLISIFLGITAVVKFSLDLKKKKSLTSKLDDQREPSRLKYAILKLSGRYDNLETELTNFHLKHVQSKTSGIIQDMMPNVYNLLKKPPAL